MAVHTARLHRVARRVFGSLSFRALETEVAARTDAERRRSRCARVSRQRAVALTMESGERERASR